MFSKKRGKRWVAILAAALLWLPSCAAQPVTTPEPKDAPSAAAREPDIIFSDGTIIPADAQEADVTLRGLQDLQQLARLTRLRTLRLRFSGFEPEQVTLEPLCGMKYLESLDAHYAGIADISPLAGLLELRSLDLNSNRIRDLSPLSQLTRLEELRLGSNQISDLSPLRPLLHLRVLVLDENPVSDLSPLAGLPEDARLWLDSTVIPWNGWGPVAHVGQVFGMPPTENAGQKQCPDTWVSRIEAAWPGSVITALDYDDYDGDGVAEAFALLQSPYGENYGPMGGRVVYVTGDSAVELESGPYMKYVSGYFRFGDVKIIKVESLVAVTSSVSLLWQVERGEARRCNLSGWGQGFHIGGDKTVRLLHSVYDGCSDGSGHSYKPYFFYFDGRDFVEYGAVELTRGQLLSYGGAQVLLDRLEADGWTLRQILYRGCGLIHLNLQKEEGEGRFCNRYLTLRPGQDGLVVEDDDMGVYLARMTVPIEGPQAVSAKFP